MKKVVTALLVVLALACLMAPARASLTTIGTATYNGVDCNLIWDENNNGNSVIWLDYTNVEKTWSDQKTWAAGLDGQLTGISTPGWNLSWTDTDWRLPSAGENPVSNYDQTSTEMGDLYYNELGLTRRDASGAVPVTAGELNATNFDRLSPVTYWTETTKTDNSAYAYSFSMATGLQDIKYKTDIYSGYGLAIRSGEVSAVPIPGALWLLSSGLLGLVVIRRRKR